MEPAQAPDPNKILEMTLAKEKMERVVDQHRVLFQISATDGLSIINTICHVTMIKLYPTEMFQTRFLGLNSLDLQDLPA